MTNVKFMGHEVNVEKDKEAILFHIETTMCEIDEVLGYEDNGKTIKVHLIIDGDEGHMVFNRRKDGFRMISSSL